MYDIFRKEVSNQLQSMKLFTYGSLPFYIIIVTVIICKFCVALRLINPSIIKPPCGNGSLYPMYAHTVINFARLKPISKLNFFHGQ